MSPPPTPRLPSAAAFLAALGAAILGCAPGGVDVTLAVDPAISTESDLALQLDALVWTLDHPTGLYPPGAEKTLDNIEVKNVDADPELELVTTFPVGASRLPQIRILQGGLSVPTFDLRILGFAKDNPSPLAEGAALGLSFSADPEVSVPFNFMDALRPPRVRHVVPANGATLVGCALTAVTLVFSRPMMASSLADAVSASAKGVESVSVGLDATGFVADVTFSPPIVGETDVSFELGVATSARADDGSPLDQAGSEPGAQPYKASFRFDCGPPPSFPCEIGSCPWACGDHECGHRPEIACIDDVCTVVACAAPCEEPFVCDPFKDACVPDCRAGTAVSACAAGTCDAATGLCAN